MRHAKARIIAPFLVVTSRQLLAPALVTAMLCAPFGGSTLGQSGVACRLRTSIACAKASASDRLDKEAGHLAENGFKPTDGDRVSIVDKDGSEEFRIELETGIDYAFIAVCGYDCSQVEMGLLNEKQERLAVSTDKGAVVILNGSIPTSGTHTVTVSAPGCNYIFCGVGLTVMRK